MGVEISYDLDGKDSRTITFLADNVRREKTGVHAKISIVAGRALLAYTVFNVERSEERNRLAKRAYEGLKEIERKQVTAADISHWLDLFCHDLWDLELERFASVDVVGDEGVKQNWLCKPYILDGAGTIMFAPPGKGKSWTTMLLAASMHHGCSTLFPVEDPVPVIYVNLERSPVGMQRRLFQVNKALGLPTNSPLPFLHGKGMTLLDMKEPIEKAVRERGTQAIFLDSISRSGGGDLNDNQHVNKIVDTLNNLAPTWFAIAHTPRQDDSHLFGSVHFEAGADIVIQMMSAWKPASIGISLRIVKANDAPLGSALKFVLDFDDDGLAAVRPAERTEFASLGAAQLQPIDDVVIAYMAEHGEGTANDIAQSSGHSRPAILKLLQRSDVFTFSRKDGTKMYYRLAD